MFGGMYMYMYLSNNRINSYFELLFVDPVTSVSFTRDRQCILVSSHDSVLRLIDTTSGELLNE